MLKFLASKTKYLVPRRPVHLTSFVMTEEPKISKNEQKRLAKLAKKEAEKAAKLAEKQKKAAEAEAKGDKSGPALIDETVMSGEQYRQYRIDQLSSLKDPYPHKFDVTISVPKYIEKYTSLHSKSTKKNFLEYFNLNIFFKIFISR